MLHELDGHLFSNEYRHLAPRAADVALYYEGRNALLIAAEGGELQLPTFTQLQGSHPGAMAFARFAFCVDEQAFFLVEGLETVRIPGASMQPIEVFRTFVPQHMGYAGVVGSQLFRFYEGNRFCGRCAEPMAHSNEERAMVCPACGLILYPKISPAVIVGVTDGDRLLLTKYAGRVYAKHALVAGFNEVGETIERTVEREVLEEVGLHVKNIRYFKSQPWPFSDSLLMGFFCDLSGSDKITLEEHELSEAQWFGRAELPPTENTMSLTNTMIEAFRANRY